MTASSRTDIPSYLFAHEWWTENYTIALTHLSIIHSLLHILEQTLPLDRYIFEGAIFDDVMICLESGTRPLRVLDWSPPDLSATEMAEIRSNLEDLRHSGLFDESGMWSSDASLSQKRTLAIFLVPLKADQRAAPMIVLAPHVGVGLMRRAKVVGNVQMLALLHDILLLVEVMQYTWISTTPPPKYAQWATMKAHAILHILLSMHLTGESECVRLSIIILLGALCSNRAWRSGAMNGNRLRAALTGEPDHLKVVGSSSEFDAPDSILVSFADQRMLFWVLVVGAASAAQTSLHDWFVNQATRLARDLGLRTEEQMREVIVEYLWLLKPQQTVIQEISGHLLSNQDLLGV